MALINWTLSKLLPKGFTPLSTPDLVRSTVVEKCGFQPRGQNTQVLVHFLFVWSFSCQEVFESAAWFIGQKFSIVPVVLFSEYFQ